MNTEQTNSTADGMDLYRRVQLAETKLKENQPALVIHLLKPVIKSKAESSSLYEKSVALIGLAYLKMERFEEALKWAGKLTSEGGYYSTGIAIKILAGLLDDEIDIVQNLLLTGKLKDEDYMFLFRFLTEQAIEITKQGQRSFPEETFFSKAMDHLGKVLQDISKGGR